MCGISRLTVKSENTVFKISAGTDTGNGSNADSSENVTDTKGQQTVSIGETGKRMNETTASGGSTLLQTGIEYIGYACTALAGIAVYGIIKKRRIK